MAFTLLTALAAQETVFRIDTRLVVLHVTATGSDGKLRKDLPKSAFQVFEDGVKQEIKVFKNEDAPVSLGLIVDNSASMTDKRAQVAAAALSLVKASNPEDEVFIVNFSDTPSLDVEFTNDIEKLRKGLALLSSRGGTAMRDALRTAVEHVKPRKQKDKKVLLVITDGADNSSLETLDRLIRAAQQSEVLIYAVCLLSDEFPREAEKAKVALDALTRATGGQAYYLKNVSEIERVAPLIAHEIRNQYTVAYSPSRQELDGTFRQVRVLVDVPGISVRTRSGYYASRDNATTVSSVREP